MTEPLEHSLPRLAVRHYAGVPLADDATVVNLAWTTDERPLLDADVDAVLRSTLATAGRTRARARVDGYGNTILGPAVRRAFGLPAGSARITTGPGVGPILSFLARLAAGRQAYLIGNSYPDFPYWVGQFGGGCTTAPAELPAGEQVARAHRSEAAVVFLERPSLTGDWFGDRAEVAELCARMPDRLVLVDESNANYCPHRFSAAGLVPAVPNLVVVRGLSKAYGLGGLRLGYCISSALAATVLRQVLPPRLVPRLTLELGAAVLELGDLTTGLRAAVGRRRIELADWLTGAGIVQLEPASEHLPYLLVWDDEEAIRRRLISRGILGKRHPMRLPSRDGLGDPYRLSVPLAPDRVATVRQRLIGPPP